MAIEPTFDGEDRIPTRGADLQDAVDVPRTSLAALAALGGPVMVLSVLYLAKSAAGINLMPGPSALHDFLFQLVHCNATGRAPRYA